ncbi:MAG TPA: HigA family addiction module antitoxin [Candidatus Rubrimentiphilum sp.]|nr:HigA family addiction module antitoxin [Candidatus Rubrimentiphilum sp.]
MTDLLLPAFRPIFERPGAIVSTGSKANAKANGVSASTIDTGSALSGEIPKPSRLRSRIITRRTSMLTVPKNRRPISPGEVLREDFLDELELTQERVAEAIGVHRTTVNEVLNGRRAITPEMALRLGHAFSTTPEYWMNLQKAVDLYDAQHSKVVREIEKLRVLA